MKISVGEMSASFCELISLCPLECCFYRKCKLNVPILNDHDLDKLDQVLISRPSIMDAGRVADERDRRSLLHSFDFMG